MYILKQLLFFILIVLVYATSFSQQITFNKVISPLGGFSGFVGGIAEDKNGYMWIATYGGLFRYDGYRFKTYVNEQGGSNSISATRLETVYADSRGMIWIATWVSGLDRLDPATGKFIHFEHDDHDPGSLSHNQVRSILEDREGVLWIGTLDGLDKYDPKTAKFQHYKNDPNDPGSLSCNRVRKIYEDNQGTIWIGTGSPWPQEGGATPEGGLNRLDKKTGKFTRYIHDVKDPHSLINNKVTSIFEDKKGNFWVGTAGDGLHTMDRGTGQFERHRYDAANPEKLSRPRLSPTDNTDYISFINEDALQNIWIGTTASGLLKYDPETRKTTHYGRKENTASFTDLSAWCYCNSADGNFWIGTFEGSLYRVDPFREDPLHVTIGYNVLALDLDSANNQWIGTTNGLVFHDAKTRNDKIFFHRDGEPASLSSDIIYSLHRDSQGTMWIGTNNGLNRFNASSKNFTRYLNDTAQKNSITAGEVYAIAEADIEHLWVGTVNGLDLMNKNTGTFIHFSYRADDTTSLNGNAITSLLPDPSGDLWVGLYDFRGLDLYDHKTRKFKHFLKKRSVTALLHDGSGTLWVGTDNGLYFTKDPADGFRRFSDPRNQIEFPIVFRIEQDKRGKLWVSTSIGILKIDSTSKQITIYGSNYGVDGGSLSLKASAKGVDDKIYFGDVIGYYAFSPDDMIGNTAAPLVQVTGFSVRGQPVKSGDHIISDSSIEKTKKIFLRANQNVFSFEFAGIHYSSPEYNRHLYMLENYDQEWHEAGAEKSASYFNVPPGKYTFRLRVASSDAVWAERSIDVVISPPWWATWWFRTLSVIAMVIVIYSIIRERSRKLKAENVRLEQKVNERTQQLQQSLHDLKSTQSQLVQSEKMASLGELTAGIAHEIQNPLNFVNNFSDVNKELIDELQAELATGNVESATRIADDIKANEQKISHHGKRADSIVKGMLQHSRTSSGQKELTDINTLADEYLRLAYHGLRAKDKSFNAKFETDLDNSIGRINIVPQDIGRVLLNLINNAFYAVGERQKSVRAGTEGANGLGYEPTVTVSTNKLKNKIEIRVKDNGNGIGQNVVDKIFQPFFTTKPTGEGTGLGLSLAYDIIKAHGGEIKVNTKESEGSEFTIELPCE